MNRSLRRLLLAALVLVAAVPAAAAPRLYHTDPGAGRIGRSDLDGTATETLIDPAGSPRDVVIANYALYWADAATNTIRRAGLDGSADTALVETEGTPTSLAADTVHGFLYWTTEFPPRIERARFDGSGVETVLEAGLALPRGLALDSEAGRLYLVNNGDVGQVLRANLDGSALVTLLQDGLSVFQDLVVDPAGSRLFWLESGQGRLETAALDGGGRTPLVNGLAAPRGLAFDPDTGKIYWSETLEPSIRRANDDGSSVETIVSEGLVEPAGLALGPDAAPSGSPPVLAPIGTLQVAQGSSRTFFIAATDADDDPLAFSASGLPPFAAFTDLGNDRAALTLNPGPGTQGSYPGAKVTVTDGLYADSETFTIVVGPPNAAPVLAPIGAQTAAEGVLTTVSLGATDPNPGQALMFSLGGNPSFVSLSDNGDGTASLAIAAGFTDAGVWPGITVSVTDGLLADSETFSLTVTNVNRAPALAAVGDRTVDEGTVTEIALSASDPDGAAGLVLSAAGLPAFVSFLDQGNGRGKLIVAPDFQAAGVYPGLTVSVTDGAAGDVETFALTVKNVNRPPVVAPVAAIVLEEEAALAIAVSAADPDGDAVSLAGVDLPPFVSFTDQGGGQGLLRVEPSTGDAGTYTAARLRASDGSLTGSIVLSITVTPLNDPPVLEPIADRAMTEGEILFVSLHASDPDGVAGLVLSASGLPPFATFADDGAGEGSLRFAPGFAGAGLYPGITVTVSDGLASDTDAFALTVFDANRPPVLARIGAQTVETGTRREIPIGASDPDGTSGLVLTAQNLPAWAAFTDQGNGIGRLVLTPGAGDVGVATGVRVLVSDGALEDEETLAIAAVSGNRPPVIQPVGDAAMVAETTLEIAVVAADPDGNEALSLVAQGLPSFATFTDLGLGAGKLVLAPPAGTDGAFGPIVLTASDGLLADDTSFRVAVRDTNVPPVLEPLADLTIAEGETAVLGLRATDADGDAVTLSAAGLPSFVTLVDGGDGRGSLTVEPGYADAGLYPGIAVRAADGIAFDARSFKLIVTNVNRPPVLEPVGSLVVAEGDVRVVPVAGVDPDGPEGLTLVAGGLPPFATFTGDGPGRGTLRIAPGFTDAGVYPAMILVVSDGSLEDVETVPLTVTELDRLPLVAGPPVILVDEGTTASGRWIARDPDGDPVVFAYPGGLPAFVAFTTSSGGDSAVAEIVVAPGFEDAGTYPFSLVAVGAGGATSVDEVLDVRDVNRPPAIAEIPAVEVAEGETLLVTVRASDPDGDAALALTAFGLPPFASFTDEGSGTGSFALAPDFAHAGVWPGVGVRADDGRTAVERTFTVTVRNVNRPPAVNPVSDVTLWEGESRSIGVTVLDPDGIGGNLVLTASGLPAFVTFTDQGLGVARVDVIPGFEDAGTYGPLTVTAEDGVASATASFSIRVLDFSRTFTLAVGPRAMRFFTPGLALDTPGIEALEPFLGPADPLMWRLGRWSAGEARYHEAPAELDSLLRGAGYWIVTRDSVLVTLEGEPWRDPEFEIPLLDGPGVSAGWNQVGNPYSIPIPVEQIFVTDGTTSRALLDPDQAFTEPTLWTWTGSGYDEAETGTVLAPRAGFWVRKIAAGPVSIVVRRDPGPAKPAGAGGVASSRPLHAAPTSSPAEGNPDVLWSVRLTASQGATRAAAVTLGIGGTSGDDWNPLDRSLAPAAPGRHLRLAVRRDDRGRLNGEYARSYVDDAAAAAWDLELRGACAGEPVAIDLAGIVNDGARRVFWSLDGGPLREATVPGTIALAPRGDLARLRVVAAASEDDVVPDPPLRPALLSADPNPFADDVELHAAVGRAGAFEIVIHDASGRLVRRLPGVASAPGTMRIRWDGRTEAGSVAPAGVYLARLIDETGGGIGAVRMVRLR